MSLQIGDTVVHSRYGVGEVTGTRKLKRDGETVHYVCIELIEDRGMLMIPEDQLDDDYDEMRPAMEDPKVIRKILNQKPEELADHHRKRQSGIESQLSSGLPSKIAAALRDLTYRERVHRLTDADTRLKQKAIRLLAEELSAQMTGTMASIQMDIKDMLNKAMHKHVPETAEASA